MMAEEYHSYLCSHCGEENETLLEATSGPRQTFVEDCAVCCRPNVVRVSIDPETSHVHIETELES